MPRANPCPKHPDATYSPAGRCRTCNREYFARWYSANRGVQLTRIRANNERQIQENQEFLWSYLSSHPCVDCGIADPRVLEADHVRGEKITEVTRLIRISNIAKIEAELAKCEIRCANCHRIKTQDQFGSWRSKQPAVSPHSYKVQKG